MKTPHEVGVLIEPSGKTREDVFNFILGFMETNTFWPTTEEIGRGVASIQGRELSFAKQSVYRHITRLAREGRIIIPYMGKDEKARPAARFIIPGGKYMINNHEQGTG